MELKGKWIEGNWALSLSLFSFPQRHLRFLTPLTLRQVACWPWHVFVTERDLKETSEELRRAEGTAGKAAPVMTASRGNRQLERTWSVVPPACTQPPAFPSGVTQHNALEPTALAHLRWVHTHSCFLAVSSPNPRLQLLFNSNPTHWMCLRYRENATGWTWLPT